MVNSGGDDSFSSRGLLAKGRIEARTISAFRATSSVELDRMVLRVSGAISVLQKSLQEESQVVDSLQARPSTLSGRPDDRTFERDNSNAMRLRKGIRSERRKKWAKFVSEVQYQQQSVTHLSKQRPAASKVRSSDGFGAPAVPMSTVAVSSSSSSGSGNGGG